MHQLQSSLLPSHFDGGSAPSALHYVIQYETRYEIRCVTLCVTPFGIVRASSLSQKVTVENLTR
jgi:hypothetical protein